MDSKTNGPTKLIPSLNRELVEQMISALREIIVIDQKQIKTTEDELKARGFRLFLSNNFLDHASEFLGSWLAVANEYEPLVHAVAAVTNRANALNQSRANKYPTQGERSAGGPEVK